MRQALDLAAANRIHDLNEDNRDSGPRRRTTQQSYEIAPSHSATSWRAPAFVPVKSTTLAREGLCTNHSDGLAFRGPFSSLAGQEWRWSACPKVALNCQSGMSALTV